MNAIFKLILRHLPILIAAMILIVIVTQVPAFQKKRYLLNLSDQYLSVAVLALALTPIVLTGGIDLSIGSVTVFSSVVMGAFWRDLGWPVEWAMAGGIAVGLGAGLCNGTLVAIGVMPLVATLATRELFRGLALSLSGSNPVADFPPWLAEVWNRAPLGIPIPLWIIGMAAVLAYLVVHHTWIGRSLYALGDNETAAQFVGLPVRSVKVGIYAAAGLAAGICGAGLVFSSGAAAKADSEKSLELTAIACVVLGGVRITGGAGHVPGTMLGIVTMVALLSGLTDVAPNWRDTITGGLVIAVAIGNEAAQRRLVRR